MVSTVTKKSANDKNGTGIIVVPITTETVFNERTCFWVNGTEKDPLIIQQMLPNTSNYSVSNLK